MNERNALVAAAVAAAGIEPAIKILDADAKTAAAAAEQLGCEVGAIANSLVFAAGDEPVLVMTSGAHRVDTALVAGALGVDRLDRASADFVRRHTGQVIGGVAPVGHPQPLRTVVDAALARYPQLWAAGGHPHSVFPTTYDELLRITGGTAMPVASEDDGQP